MSSFIALRAQIENITAPIHSPQTQRMVFISNLRLCFCLRESRLDCMCVSVWGRGMEGMVVFVLFPRECFNNVNTVAAVHICDLSWACLCIPRHSQMETSEHFFKDCIYNAKAAMALGASAVVLTLVNTTAQAYWCYNISMHCVSLNRSHCHILARS